MFGKKRAFNERDYITPEAFSVKPELLGTPLAHPTRRLMAWLLDALIVAIIGQLSNVLLALALALLFDRILRQTEIPFAKRWREHLRIAVVAVFVVWALVEAWSLWGHHQGAVSSGRQEAATIEKLEKLDKGDQKRSDSPVTSDDKDEDTDVEAGGNANVDKMSDEERIKALKKEVKELEASKSFSLIDTLKNLMGDIGFDLGWAAVYWTLLTGWWNGQTLGKRLFGLRAVQLNGEPFTMWDSFNRCGGYAAGVATGLLGFAQAWWDSNRQAIHDKVAFTVVIDERREKIPWPVERDQQPS